MSTASPDPRTNGVGPGASVTAARASNFSAPGSIVTDHVEELVAAWRRGDHLHAEDFLARDSELGDEAAIRLIYEEFSLRQEAGQQIDPAEITRRFPQWRDQLMVLLDCQRLIDSAPARANFPNVGEVLAGFRLLAELGRGAAGRVFLAAQPSLGDRPVVLKVTPRGRDEHLSLARLQHMNIVPLYSEHKVQARNLQIMCMPFLGGATLAQVLEQMRDRPVERRTGRLIIEAIDQIQIRQPIDVPAGGPFRRFIARASYVEAICTIGAGLADGLQYAHERELVHMDIKPSNVLLACDGQPMLLDFHLARGPISPDDPPPTWMGGTLEFMSPEQSRALAAVREGRPVHDAVDCRADIYSLGMLLNVALGGPVPDLYDTPLPSLHRLNPHVSIGLSDIITKCLSHDPEDRYRDVAALASDLRRHLADLPLRGVVNRSWTERWHKWRRQRPSAVSRRGLMVLLVVAALLGLTGSLGFAYRQRVEQIEDAVDQSRAHLRRSQYAEAEETLRHGLVLVDHLPGVVRQRQWLKRKLDQTLKRRKADELHSLAELIRFRYGLAPPPAEDAPPLIRLGRKTWEARDSLLQGPGDPRDIDIDRRVRTDLMELVLLWADLRVRYAQESEAERARQEAIGILSEAEAVFGSHVSLDRQRRACAGMVEPDTETNHPATVPGSVAEYYDLGKSFLRSGKLDRAAEQFRKGLDLQPQDFWLNFYQGLCDYRLERFEAASSAFRVCIALSPDTAECYYNRALAYQALDQRDRALADYTRALALSPSLTDAALNRGMLFYRQGRHDDAIADLQRALATTTTRSVLGVINYNLAVIHLARGDRDAASTTARNAIAFGNHDAVELSRRLVQQDDAAAGSRSRRVQ